MCMAACPYGARELDEDQGVMKKCTLCIDSIYNETLPPSARVPAADPVEKAADGGRP